MSSEWAEVQVPTDVIRSGGASIHSALTSVPQSLSAAVALLVSVRPTKRMRWLLSACVGGELALKTAKAVIEKRRAAHVYTVTVHESNEAYALLHGWLLGLIPHDQRRALIVGAGRRHEGDDPLVLYYDGAKTQEVTIGAHRVEVKVAQPTASMDLGEDTPIRFNSGRASLVFTARSTEARESVLEFIRDVVRTSDRPDQPRLFVASHYGGWNRQRDVPARSIESVVLKEGQMEALTEDLGWFLSTEEAYGRMGLPWHRGYLLYGPPGTGKTSVVKALAAHFGLDLHFVPLSDLPDDTRLSQLLTEVGPRSVLLLEDVDIAHGAKSRDDATVRRQITLSGLLNALDGVATPHGLITMMTSNDRDVLDPALIRPGRADVQVHLSHLSAEQLLRLVKVMHGSVPAWMEKETMPEGLTPAEVVEALGPRGSKDNAEERLRTLIGSYLVRPSSAAARHAAVAFSSTSMPLVGGPLGPLRGAVEPR